MIYKGLIQSFNSYARSRKRATCAPKLRALCVSSLLTCVIGSPISLAKSSMSFLSVSESLSTSRYPLNTSIARTRPAACACKSATPMHELLFRRCPVVHTDNEKRHVFVA
jgi:hypothetical protein